METIQPNIIICIVAIIIATAAVIANFAARRWSCLLSFIAIALIYFLGNAGIPSQTLWFWGSCSLLAWGICVLLPRQVMDSRFGLNYIAVGALAGTFVGILISLAAMIIGALLGAFCGALAFSRTPAGKTMRFPSRQFLNYLCAKGLPSAVCMCIAALTVYFTLLH